VTPVFGRAVSNLTEIGEADLIVGADGVNSLVRRTHEKAFGSSFSYLDNRITWFGTDRPFDTLSQTFRETAFGCFNAHHYRYAPDLSTFIIETDPATFARAGFEGMNEAQTIAACGAVFATALDGHKLISNNSVWRRFPQVWNERWHHGKYVLIGDALRTAHFSIGSGTRLAMEDAIALDKALAAHPRDTGAALAAYEAARRPVVEKLVAGANASAAWYERFAEHMALAPLDFAMSYVTRSGRIDRERLRRVSPQFVARYERERGLAAGS
jgi:2-polyprenyl-6-methoxyphenol hydroxylase-like FAD-dependent oxidoreductase